MTPGRRMVDWVVNFLPLSALIPREGTQLPLVRKVGERAGRGGEERNRSWKWSSRLDSNSSEQPIAHLILAGSNGTLGSIVNLLTSQAK